MSIRRIFIALAVAACAARPVFATAQRTFVSHAGLDTNACSVDAPCRTFAAALTQTVAGGEVIVLDSAGYGPVTIAQSVTITAPAGIYGGISVTSGDGVTVSAAASDNVSLRNLAINYLAGTGNGINVVNAASVEIERCRVSGAFQSGIVVIPPTAAVIRVAVTDTVVRSPILYGLRAEDSTMLWVVRSRFELMNAGGPIAAVLVEASHSNATISDSDFDANSCNGVQVSGANVQVTGCRFLWNNMGVNAVGGAVDVTGCAFNDNAAGVHFDGSSSVLGTVTRSTFNANQVGVLANNSAKATMSFCNCNTNTTACAETATNAVMRLTQNTITNNNIGLIDNGSMESLGNNIVRGNGTDILGTAPAVVAGN